MRVVMDRVLQGVLPTSVSAPRRACVAQPPKCHSFGCRLAPSDSPLRRRIRLPIYGIFRTPTGRRSEAWDYRPPAGRRKPGEYAGIYQWAGGLRSIVIWR
jgi:hypothetical protein